MADFPHFSKQNQQKDFDYIYPIYQIKTGGRFYSMQKEVTKFIFVQTLAGTLGNIWKILEKYHILDVNRCTWGLKG